MEKICSRFDFLFIISSNIPYELERLKHHSASHKKSLLSHQQNNVRLLFSKWGMKKVPAISESTLKEIENHLGTLHNLPLFFILFLGNLPSLPGNDVLPSSLSISPFLFLFHSLISLALSPSLPLLPSSRYLLGRTARWTSMKTLKTKILCVRPCFP